MYREVLTSNVQVSISKYVAMFVCSITLNCACVLLGHIEVNDGIFLHNSMWIFWNFWDWNPIDKPIYCRVRISRSRAVNNNCFSFICYIGLRFLIPNWGRPNLQNINMLLLEMMFYSHQILILHVFKVIEQATFKRAIPESCKKKGRTNLHIPLYM